MARLKQPKTQNCLLLLLAAIAGGAYFPLDHSVTNAHALTTGFDGDIPVVAVFAVPYLAFLPILWLMLVTYLVSGRDIARIAIALTLAYLVGDACFVLYPTYMPRPAHVGGLLGSLVTFIYRHDGPYNDLPSEHVASTVLLALYLWPRSGALRLVGQALALLVIPSTLLIKQHSIAGAATGVLVGFGAWWLAGRMRRAVGRRSESRLGRGDEDRQALARMAGDRRRPPSIDPVPLSPAADSLRSTSRGRLDSR